MWIMSTTLKNTPINDFAIIIITGIFGMLGN